MPSTPQQLRTRARFEALIGLAAPVLDLVLVAGERVSRFAAPDDDYVPIRAAADRVELGRARRSPPAGRRPAPVNRREIIDREQRGASASRASRRLPRPRSTSSRVALRQSGSVPITGPRHGAATGRSTTRRGQLLASASCAASRSCAARDPAALPLPGRPGAQRARQRRRWSASSSSARSCSASRGSSPGSRRPSVASDFVAQSAAGGDIYTLLDDLIDGSTR